MSHNDATKKCFLMTSPQGDAQKSHLWLLHYQLSIFMASIEKAFRRSCEKHPNHSTYICYLRAVRGWCLTRRSVAHWFKRLVDPDDYVPKERCVSVAHIHNLSQQNTGGKRAVTAQKSSDTVSVESVSEKGSETKTASKSAVVEASFQRPSFAVDTLVSSR